MEQLDVKILDRDYRLAVSADERQQLLSSVQMVDDKMRSIRESGKLTSVERIAVMAALQLAHDLIASKTSAPVAASADIIRRIRKMSDDVDAELRRQEALF